MECTLNYTICITAYQSYGISHRKSTKETYEDVTLLPKDCVEMLSSSHRPTRETSRYALGDRIKMLKEILLIKNSLGETQKTVSLDALDAELETKTIKKLNKENLYKRAYDAIEDHTPSSCVIC